MLQAVIQIRRANNSVDCIACLEFMFRFFLKKKNRGVTGIHTSIRSSDNDSTGFWPPGSLHTLGADGHI